MVVENVSVILFDPEEYQSFFCNNATILNSAFEHIGVDLRYCRRYKPVSIIAELLL